MSSVALATEADAIAIYGSTYVTRSCDRDGDGTLDSSALDLALIRASQLIRGYLVGRVAIETPVQAILVKYCVDIAIEDVSHTADTLTKQKKVLANRARSWLKAVSKGEIAQDQTTPAVPKGVAAYVVSENEREINRDTLGYLF